MPKKEVNKNSIIEYVKQNDKTFEEMPFNSVDALVLSQASYFNYIDIVPSLLEEKESISFSEIKESYKTHLTYTLVDAPLEVELFLALRKSPRFKNIRLCLFIDEMDFTNEVEFSAVTYILDEKYAYVAYRGTSTLLGWKEDFNMIYLDRIPSQEKAKNYLEKVVKIVKQNLFIGGHSKGGNLALYASLHINILNFPKIKKIYLYDSPGFRQEILNKFRMKLVLKKMIKIVPNETMIGILLNTAKKYKIISSTKKGVMQHDPFTWIIKNNDFVYETKRSKKSIFVERTITKWLDNIPIYKRKLFVDNLYKLLITSKAKTIWDIPRYIIKNRKLINNELKKMDKETKKSLTEVIKMLTKIAINNLKNN